MFRKQITEDIQKVFGFTNVRICGIDEESECIFCNPVEIVSTPIVGSGKTHFRIYCDISIVQDEANGKFGWLAHTFMSSKDPAVKCFQMVSESTGAMQSLYEQHRIIETIRFCWERDLEWNQAPKVTDGEVVMTEE